MADTLFSERVQENALPYTVYTALITQTSTNSPVATILENTTGATLTWAYVSTGRYTLTSDIGSLFNTAKTVINTQALRSTPGSNSFSFEVGSNTGTVITFFTKTPPGFETETDDALSNSFIEIRVYP